MGGSKCRIRRTFTSSPRVLRRAWRRRNRVRLPSQIRSSGGAIRRSLEGKSEKPTANSEQRFLHFVSILACPQVSPNNSGARYEPGGASRRERRALGARVPCWRG